MMLYTWFWSSRHRGASFSQYIRKPTPLSGVFSAQT